MRFLLVFIFCSTPVWAQMRIIPHVTRPDGSFTTEIFFQNTSPRAEQVTLVGYDANGNVLQTTNLALGPFEGFSGDSTTIFGTDVSHFSIEGKEMLKTSLNYQAITQGAAPANVGEKPSVFDWYFYGGDWTTTFDALAVVNTDDTAPAQVIIQQWHEDGSFINQVTLEDNLAPWAKSLFVMSTAFVNQPQTYFEVVSDRRISIIGLRGNLDSTFLWENNLIPVPNYQNVLSRELLGLWVIEYSTSADFSRIYSISSPSTNLNADGELFVFGIDETGIPDVTAAYFGGDLQIYSILDEANTQGGTADLYLFDFQNGNLVNGCHFNAFADGTFSDCHPATGGVATFSVNKTGKRLPANAARLSPNYPTRELDPEFFASKLREASKARTDHTTTSNPKP